MCGKYSMFNCLFINAIRKIVDLSLQEKQQVNQYHHTLHVRYSASTQMVPQVTSRKQLTYLGVLHGGQLSLRKRYLAESQPI